NAALWALAMEGLLEMRDGESAVVRQAAEREIPGIFATSLVLETLVARELAIREERSFGRLDELQEGMRRLIAEPKEAVGEFTELEREMYCAIAAMVGYK